MSQDCSPPSRGHDLLGALLGLFCFAMLILSYWQIDRDVPYPFYAGPLLVPLLVLSMGSLASLPSWRRLLFPAPGATWYLDGQGPPSRGVIVLVLGMLYPILIKYAGLEAATFIVLSLELYCLGQRGLWKNLVFPALIALLFWLVFKRLLDVYFPTPELLYFISG